MLLDAAMPGRFALQGVVSEGRHRLIFSGELDLLAVPVVEACLGGLWAEGTTGVVLDFRRVTFMDSTGLHLTLRVRELCEQHECEFLLIQGPPQVRRLFEIGGLLDCLPFQDEADEVAEPETRATRTEAASL
jgi:anti-sigma B factor antagonist